MSMLKNDINIIDKNGLNFVMGPDGRPLRFTPWLGDFLSFLYDLIMEKSIFPRKFGGDITRHYDILRRELKNVHGKRVLELATGSGSAVNFLDSDNVYVGTDISPGLLRKAMKRFSTTGFTSAEFYVASADDLPFDDAVFEVCLCLLSLNFFTDLAKVAHELNRILASGSVFLCAVPVPERNTQGSKIRGTLYSEDELIRIFRGNGFMYERIPSDNGTLLYFKGIKE